MSHKFKPIFSLMLIFAIFFCLASSASAVHTRASDRFAYTDAWISKSGGEILVEYSIDATGTMKELGVSEITIWEEQSNGNYDDVKTFTRYDTSYLISKNTHTTGGEVSFRGTPGAKYYASIVFYAKNASGSETLYFDTNTITI